MAIVPGTNVIARELTVAVPEAAMAPASSSALAWCPAAFRLYGPPSDDGCAGWPR